MYTFPAMEMKPCLESTRAEATPPFTWSVQQQHLVFPSLSSPGVSSFTWYASCGAFQRVSGATLAGVPAPHRFVGGVT